MFYQLVNVLRNSVKKMENGSRFWTERELSLQYGISRVTVAHAVNQLVNDGYLYRIQGKGTFVRQKPAPSKSHNILVILPQPIRDYIEQHNYAMAETLQGIINEANSSGKLLLVDLPKGVNETVFCIDRMTDSLVSGVVLFAFQGLGDILAVAEREKIPTASIFVKGSTYYNWNNVLSKENEGSRRAVEYLVSLGHKRIAFLGPRYLNIAPVADRYLGYEQAMTEAGLPVIDARHEDTLGDYSEDRAAGLFRGSEHPSAILAANDHIAIHTINAITQMGFTVPGDVSVIGFDDIPPAGAFTPALTTVREPRYEMGREVVRYLTSIIDEGYSVQGCRTLDTELVIRESCASPKTDLK